MINPNRLEVLHRPAPPATGGPTPCAPLPGPAPPSPVSTAIPPSPHGTSIRRMSLGLMRSPQPPHLDGRPSGNGIAAASAHTECPPRPGDPADTAAAYRRRPGPDSFTTGSAATSTTAAAKRAPGAERLYATLRSERRSPGPAGAATAAAANPAPAFPRYRTAGFRTTSNRRRPDRSRRASPPCRRHRRREPETVSGSTTAPGPDSFTTGSAATSNTAATGPPRPPVLRFGTWTHPSSPASSSPSSGP